MWSFAVLFVSCVYVCDLFFFALHTQDAAALAAELYASLTRTQGMLSCCNSERRLSPEEAGRQLEADTKRVKTYFSALLIEQGIPVTAWCKGS